MSAPGFSLRQIRYFLAVAEAGTISGAAEQLGISQAAMTEALDELEKQLGLPLLVRRRARGVALTRPGRELLAHCRAFVTAATDLQLAAETRGSILAGRVAIGCYSTLAPFVIPALLAAFSGQHPAVQVEVFYGSGDEISVRLHEGHCDVALLYEFNLPPSTERDTLYRVRPRVVLPATHRLAGGGAIDLADLVDEPMVQFDVEPALEYTRRICEAVGIAPRLGLKARTVELTRSLVGHGFGYAILLHHPPGDLSYEGRELVVRDIARLDLSYEVVLARSTYLRASKRSEDLRQFCLSCFRERGSGATPAQADRSATV